MGARRVDFFVLLLSFKAEWYWCAGAALVLLSVLPASSGDAVPQGKVLEGRHLTSAVLGRDVNYAVYLPPDYDLSTRR